MLYNPDLQSSTQKAFAEALGRLGMKYKNFVVLNSNLSEASGVQSFAKIFPDRFFHFGNAVENMFGAAQGFTVRGKLPILCTYATMASGKVWDTVRNYICHPNLNIKIVGFRSGILNSEEGAVNQAVEDIALMRCIPNMKIFSPADATETRKVLEVMLADYGPAYLRLTHAPLPDLYDDRYLFEIGKGHIYRPGSDVCIFAHGVALHMALDAAQALEREGVSCMVVNMSSLEPIDSGLIIECAKAVNHIVTIEDHSIKGGLGSAVVEVLSHEYPAKVLRLGINGFGESGKVDDLFRKHGLNSIGIAEKIQEACALQKSEAMTF